MNVATIIIGLVVLTCILLAVKSIIKDKKSGKTCSSCGGSCSHCMGVENEKKV